MTVVCAVCGPRGPRKGAPVWGSKKDPTTRRIIVNPEVIIAELLALEAETGDCADCAGSGQTVRRVGPDGVTHGPCRRCDGTGRAPRVVGPPVPA